MPLNTLHCIGPSPQQRIIGPKYQWYDLVRKLVFNQFPPFRSEIPRAWRRFAKSLSQLCVNLAPCSLSRSSGPESLHCTEMKGFSLNILLRPAVWLEKIQILMANAGFRKTWGNNSQTELWEERQIWVAGGKSLQACEMKQPESVVGMMETNSRGDAKGAVGIYSPSPILLA